MATKKIVDAIPPVSGREYKVTTLGNGNSKIEDVTQYEQEGSTFGAKEVLEGCFVECDYSYSNKTHTITSSNAGAKNIKFFATHDFGAGDTLLLNDEKLVISGESDLGAGSFIFQKNSYVFGFVFNGRFFLQSSPSTANRVVKESTLTTDTKDNAQQKREWSNGKIDFVSEPVFFGSYSGITDVSGYALNLKAKGYRGTVSFVLGSGAIAPILYCVGQIIIPNEVQCVIIIYGKAGELYRGAWQDSDWSGWYKFSGTKV